MRMEHVKILLPDYASGKLEAGMKQVVEGHLRECVTCRQDWDEVTQTFKDVHRFQLSSPSNSYFASLVPRVHERLQRKTPRPWLANPLFEKFGLPLATAILVVGLLVNIKEFDQTNSPQNPLSPVFDGVEPEEIVDIVMQDSRPIPWMTGQVQDVAQALIGDHLTREHFLEDAVASGFQPDFDGDLPISSQQLLRGLDEKQVERLLKKLEERAIL